jgi:hypothetical protein
MEQGQDADVAVLGPQTAFDHGGIVGGHDVALAEQGAAWFAGHGCGMDDDKAGFVRDIVFFIGAVF